MGTETALRGLRTSATEVSYFATFSVAHEEWVDGALANDDLSVSTRLVLWLMRLPVKTSCHVVYRWVGLCGLSLNVEVTKPCLSPDAREIGLMGQRSQKTCLTLVPCIFQPPTNVCKWSIPALSTIETGQTTSVRWTIIPCIITSKATR